MSKPSPKARKQEFLTNASALLKKMKAKVTWEKSYVNINNFKCENTTKFNLSTLIEKKSILSQDHIEKSNVNLLRFLGDLRNICGQVYMNLSTHWYSLYVWIIWVFRNSVFTTKNHKLNIPKLNCVFDFIKNKE